ncbi:MAG: YceD family protein [Thermoanaerobaculia bacterium]|nr:YceD family protein [Thermoanaerobaculia bacterium]
MKVRLDRIDERPFTWSEQRRFSTETLDSDGLIGLGEVSWRGSVGTIGRNYLLRAQLDYRQRLECARCLAATEEPVSTEIELLIVAEPGEPTVGEYELNESDLGVVYAEGDELDLDPLLLEQLQLNVPMHPLCSEACAGLCPVCGADRNQGECNCAPAPADPRLAALADLKSRFENR